MLIFICLCLGKLS